MSRSAQFAALLTPLAALAVAAACTESGVSAPTALATPAASIQTATAGGSVGPAAKAPGGVRAYAFTSGGTTPTLDAARTNGFIAISSPVSGVYCLTPAAGISPATAPALVGTATNFYHIVSWDQATTLPGACAAGQYRVTVFATDFHALSPLGGFTIIVP